MKKKKILILIAVAMIGIIMVTMEKAYTEYLKCMWNHPKGNTDEYNEICIMIARDSIEIPFLIRNS